MRLQITVDNIPHQIDSNNPRLLAAWLTELFAKIEPEMNAATHIEVRAWPMPVPGGDMAWSLDWIADSRVMGQAISARSPREVAAALSEAVEQAGQMQSEARHG